MTGEIKNFFFPNKNNCFKPRFFQPEFLFTFVVVIFALRIAFLPFYLPFSKTLLFSKVVSTEIITLLNQQRKSEGLAVLKVSPKLARAAHLKAEDMLNKDYFAHKSPDGLMGWDFINEVGYKYSVAGENLAIGFLDSLEVHKAWNNSPLHQRNLLDPRFTEVGVAVSSGEFKGKTTTVIVQLFGEPASLPAPATGPKPAPENEKIANKPDTGIIIPQEPAVVDMEPEVLPNTEPETVPEAELPIIKPENKGDNYVFWNFFIKQYNSLAQKAVLGLSGGIGALLFLNLGSILFSSLEKDLKFSFCRDIALQGGVAFLILLFLGLINKTFIIQLIPHIVRI